MIVENVTVEIDYNILPFRFNVNLFTYLSQRQLDLEKVPTISIGIAQI